MNALAVAFCAGGLVTAGLIVMGCGAVLALALATAETDPGSGEAEP